MTKFPWAIAALGVALTGPVRAQDCAVLVLYQDMGRFGIRTEVVSDGATRVLPAEGAGSIVAPVLPVAPGVSGDLIRAAERRDLALTCAEGRAHTMQRAVAGGEARAMPPVDLRNYQRYDLRVNVLDHESRGVAFAVRGARVEPADGLVFDMFRGMIPMAPGDVSITLEVQEAEVRTVSEFSGRVPLSTLGPYTAVPIALPGGGVGRFIFDVAAARTVVARRLLPPDARLTDLVAVEHSADGQRMRRGTVQGAGGAVSAVQQLVDLPWLEIGALRVEGITALVLDSAPFTIDGEPIDGILGLDVLRRAGRVRGSFGRPSGPAEVSFGGPPIEAALEFPLVPIRGVLAVQGSIGDLPVHLILDSGARMSMVPYALAEREGWSMSREPVDSLRGLDGGFLPAHTVTLPPIRVAEWTAPSSEFLATQVSVIKSMGLRGDAAVLGQPFWQAVGEVELDFERGVLRIARLND